MKQHPIVDAFLKAVYPEMTELAVTTARTEDAILKDATERIAALSAWVKELEKRDEVWRKKKEILENDLAVAWKKRDEAKGLREAVEWALTVDHNKIAGGSEGFKKELRRKVGGK